MYRVSAHSLFIWRIHRSILVSGSRSLWKVIYVTKMYFKINTLYCSHQSIHHTYMPCVLCPSARPVFTFTLTSTDSVHLRTDNTEFSLHMCRHSSVMLGAHQVSGKRVSKYTFKCTIYDDYLGVLPNSRNSMTISSIFSVEEYIEGFWRFW